MRTPPLFLTAAVLASVGAPTFASQPPSQVIEMDSPKVSDSRLDSLRGGADVSPALHISFGLDRLTSVNGTLIASTQFQVQDIGHVTPAEAQAIQQSLGSLLTVSNGHASLTQLSAGNQSLGTVIQNSLPNQSIKNIVTLDVTTNSLTLLRASNAMDQLRNLSLPGH
jgi:hypothetical protein